MGQTKKAAGAYLQTRKEGRGASSRYPDHGPRAFSTLLLVIWRHLGCHLAASSQLFWATYSYQGLYAII